LNCALGDPAVDEPAGEPGPGGESIAVELEPGDRFGRMSGKADLDRCGDSRGDLADRVDADVAAVDGAVEVDDPDMSAATESIDDALTPCADPWLCRSEPADDPCFEPADRGDRGGIDGGSGKPPSIAGDRKPLRVVAVGLAARDDEAPNNALTLGAEATRRRNRAAADPELPDDAALEPLVLAWSIALADLGCNGGAGGSGLDDRLEPVGVLPSARRSDGGP